MKQRSIERCRQSDLRAGQDLKGFHIDYVTPLPELRATAIGATHLKSGAKFLHVHAPEDSENGFAVTFLTPPTDDTGLPHIMEHVTCCGGSQKYPVRNPVFEMLKTSMSTYINASTCPAYTTYPVASNIRQDFFNLADTYLDFVFHPELKEDAFRREGYHLTLVDNNDLSSPLTISGIVYNEMKGAYSSPDALMWQKVASALCPDTPLGRDPVGDPEKIPDLTYEKFLDFYREFYHPSNALVFFYGDITTLDHLSFLAPVLDQFDRRPMSIIVPQQPRWPTPRHTEAEYPIGQGDDAAGRTFHTLNWIVGDALDTSVFTDWRVLSTVLLENEAAPLKKALVDSKLGADIFFAAAYGFEREMVFSVGIKGSEPDRADAFERKVSDILEKLATEPFAPDCVEAAYQQLALQSCEITQQFPIRILRSTNLTWPHGGDPLAFLQFGALLENSRERYMANPHLFNNLIRHGLLDNSHRLRITLRPDKEMQARRESAFASRMSELRSRMTPEQIASIAKSAAILSATQSIPNPPETLAKLPQLRVADLPSKTRHIPTEIGRIGSFELLRNNVFSNGINYLEISMDLQELPAELYPWLPRFGDVFSKMGVSGQDFKRVAARRAASTSGLYACTTIFNHASVPGKTLHNFHVGLKMLDRQAENAMSLLGDLIFSADPRDTVRLRDVMTQSRSRLRTTLVNDGTGTARRQASRGLSPAAAMEHLFVSPDALRFVEALTSEFDARAEEIIMKVESVRAFLADHARWTLSFTGSNTGFRAMEKKLEEWSRRVSNLPAHGAPPPFKPFSTPPPREGLAGPMTVAFCAKSMPVPHLAHPDTPLFRIGTHIANFDYMLPEIRFKGNAYGGGVMDIDTQGTLTLTSYRDPRIVETLDVFDGLRRYVVAQEWTQVEIDRAIIARSKEGQKPIRPSDATGAALLMHLRGDTSEMREHRYEATLRATPDQVRKTFLRVLDTSLPKAAVCVVASRKALEEANKRLGPSALIVSDILPNP